MDQYKQDTPAWKVISLRGHIRPRGNKWVISVYLGIGADGRKKYKWYSGYKTKGQAEADLPRILTELQGGQLADAESVTVAEFMQLYIDYKRKRVRQTTLNTHVNRINKHIIPAIGNIKLKKLTPVHVQTFYDGLDTIKPASVQHVHVLLKSILRHAVKWGYLTRNVADITEPPRADRYTGRYWTADEVSTFLSYVGDHYLRTFFYTAIYTGMRSGELLGLKWGDVDLARSVINVRRRLYWINGDPNYEQPKTESGRRQIDIPQILVDELKRHKREQNEWRLQVGEGYEDTDNVFANAQGEPMRKMTLHYHWTRLVEKAGLPRIRFHDLRHTHASLLLQQGVQPKIVSERLGHANIGITLNIYSHVIPGLQKEASDKFASMLDVGQGKR